ncbi:hypothetical protein [Enterococcus avium]|nr:hypothetical protein [Enterococcus avium]
MNYQEIKSLFPSSSLQTTNDHSPDDIAIPVEAGWNGNTFFDKNYKVL